MNKMKIKPTRGTGLISRDTFNQSLHRLVMVGTNNLTLKGYLRSVVVHSDMITIGIDQPQIMGESSNGKLGEMLYINDHDISLFGTFYEPDKTRSREIRMKKILEQYKSLTQYRPTQPTGNGEGSEEEESALADDEDDMYEDINN